MFAIIFDDDDDDDDDVVVMMMLLLMMMMMMRILFIYLLSADRLNATRRYVELRREQRIFLFSICRLVP